MQQQLVELVEACWGQLCTACNFKCNMTMFSMYQCGTSSFCCAVINEHMQVVYGRMQHALPWQDLAMTLRNEPALHSEHADGSYERQLWLQARLWHAEHLVRQQHTAIDQSSSQQGRNSKLAKVPADVPADENDCGHSWASTSALDAMHPRPALQEALTSQHASLSNVELAAFDQQSTPSSSKVEPAAVPNSKRSSKASSVASEQVKKQANGKSQSSRRRYASTSQTVRRHEELSQAPPELDCTWC